jgi:hypothetical protein
MPTLLFLRQPKYVVCFKGSLLFTSEASQV